MIETGKPKIGLLGIMQELYDDSYPDITELQENYAEAVCNQLGDVAEWTFPGAARNREDIERILAEFNVKNLDGVMIVMLTYGPSMRTVHALQKNSLPILLANIQPVPEVRQDWNMKKLTLNQGIHGAQDMANALLRTIGDHFEVISADWKSDEFKDFTGAWARAVAAASALRKMKIAVFGKMHGMGDTLSDEAAFTRIIGPEVNREYIGEIYRHMERVSDGEIDKQMEMDRENFEVDKEMPEENFRYAVRMYLGFKAFLEDHQYRAF
ncbi:MAG: hypothetical protein WD035_04555, partial [Balneolaceae bacterium]